MPSSQLPADTIAATATAAGASAVAIVRVSGPLAAEIARRVTGRMPHPGIAKLSAFRDSSGAIIDRGLVLYFPSPRSYTGEDVVEFQCHGGAVVVDWLVETIHSHGARPAQPGEFTLRAFLNDKLDLVQAEAVADIVSGASRAAVQAALRSLSGVFSARVAAIQSGLTELRVLCEAWLDFPDEELDVETLRQLAHRARALDDALADLERRAEHGAVLRDGLRVAIAGPPNAGKSSLLNRLSGHDAAIVTAQPGTTRDALRERIVIDGLPLEVVDTAGLRDASDVVEIEGVRRAKSEVSTADHVLWLADVREGLPRALALARDHLPEAAAFTVLLNKIDLVQQDAVGSRDAAVPVLEISALTGQGLPALTEHLKKLAGFTGRTDGTFAARRRHLDALARTKSHVRRAIDEIDAHLEIAAEELRAAQRALSEITGEVSSEDLLGEIFGRFCIGK